MERVRTFTEVLAGSFFLLCLGLVVFGMWHDSYDTTWPLWSMWAKIVYGSSLLLSLFGFMVFLHVSTEVGKLEDVILKERKLKEDLALHYLCLVKEGALRLVQAAGFEQAMQCLARQYFEAHQKMIALQRVRTDPDDELAVSDHKYTAHAFEVTKARYWEYSKFLLKENGRKEKESWRDDLPEDLQGILPPPKIKFGQPRQAAV